MLAERNLIFISIYANKYIYIYIYIYIFIRLDKKYKTNIFFPSLYCLMINLKRLRFLHLLIFFCLV